MSLSEEVSNTIITEESRSTNFVFIKIEEDIKMENFEEDEGHTFSEEEEERSVEYKTHQEEPNNAAATAEETCLPNHLGSKKVMNNADHNSKVYSCDKCSISFVSPVFLNGHKSRCRATRTDINPLEVQTNLDVLDSEQEKPLRKVKARVPAGELKYNCETCGRGFVRLCYLKAHEASHEIELKCDKCPYSTDYKPNLSRHMKVHYSDEEKIYACPHCSYIAGKSSYLRRHVAKHVKGKPHKCHVCSYKTAVTADLIRHMGTHNGEKAFPCPHCYYSAAKKTNLEKHVTKFHSTQSKTGT